MKGLERLAILRDISLRKGRKWVYKDIFRLLNKEDIWYIAYKNVIRIENNASTILSEVEEQKLTNLRITVIKENYRPLLIEGSHKKERKIEDNVPFNLWDRVVLEVIKMILISIYEPIFYESHFGLLVNKNEHSALEYLEAEFSLCDSVIQGSFETDIGSFDSNLLVNFLKKKITDVRFINLIKRILNTESKIVNSPKKTLSQNEQKETLKYALFHFYLHEFDEWVEKSKSKYFDISNKKYNQASISLSNTKSGIKYVRYMREWVIGIQGTSNLMGEFKKETHNFLIHILKLGSIKTKIISLGFGNISFLNYEIYLSRAELVSKFKNRTDTESKILKFDPPIRDILNELKNNGIIKPLIKGYRPISKTNIIKLEDFLIVCYFHSIWMSLVKYYSGTTNPNRLQYIHHLLKISCAMTLAHKHKCSCREIFKKRGKSLTFGISTSNRKICFPSKSKLSFTNRKWQTSNVILNPFKIIKNMPSIIVK